jgi:methionine aminopeptidase
VAAVQSNTQPNPSAPFNAWQRATAALREAEHRGATHPEIVRLAEQVIRTRNALVLDRLQAGWQPHHDVLHHLISDEELLREKDDSSYQDITASTT